MIYSANSNRFPKVLDFPYMLGTNKDFSSKQL